MLNELMAVLVSMHVTVVHLTFDDGPHPIYTRQVIQILHDANVDANFFLVGENVKKYPDLVNELIKEGHDIGAHSMTHKELTKIPFDQAKKEIEDSMALVSSFRKTNLFRFPYGSFNDKLLSVLRKNNWQNVYWGVDTTDWKYKDADEIYAKFKIRLAREKDGSIVLMHDIHPQSVKALKMILRYLKENHIAVEKLKFAPKNVEKTYESFF